ncbi:MAG: fibronectin type III domain-containing protein, partial [Candidatus Riflebacteria bacterium]|nr:fibronectin type III domain-containing protein [Candidatus Riflebacteria bacterium]
MAMSRVSCCRSRSFLALALLIVALAGPTGQSLGSDGSASVFQGADRAHSPKLTPAQSALFTANARLKVRWDHNAGVPASIRGFSTPVWGNSAGAASRFLDGIKETLKVDDLGAQLKVRQIQKDGLGGEHVRFGQRYRGLPVIGSGVAVHIDRSRQIYQVSAHLSPGIDVSVVPRISSEKALEAGRRALAKQAVKVRRKPTLVVLPYGAHKAHLAWEYMVSATGNGPRAWTCYVDAHSGRLLARRPSFVNIAPPTANGSSVTITGSRLDTEDGSQVSVVGWRDDTNNAWYLYTQNSYWYVFNYWTWAPTYPDDGTYAHRTGGPDWGTSDPAEISLGYNFQAIQDFCTNVLGYASFDGAGQVAIANAHYSEDGTPYNNAGYSSATEQFYFGDGNGTSTGPLVSLDVAAHEFGHAITDHNSALVYAIESGALNESFSDIYAAAVELNTQPDGRAQYPNKQAGYADWLVGEDVLKAGQGTAMRDMRNPSSATTIAPGYPKQPSRYHGANWIVSTNDESGDYGGVHYNGGPHSFAYYLLSEGGVGLNDGLPYSITGIGWQNGVRVAHRASSVYLSSSSTYRDTRNAWVSAATDLQGMDDWVTPVQQAFDAIGIIDVPTPVTEGFEGAGLPGDWVTWGDGTWSVTTTHVEGSQSAAPGPIGNGQTAYLQTTVNPTCTSQLSFFAQTSSEYCYDKIIFWVDSNPVTEWSGALAWTSYCTTLTAGEHTLTWGYRKDTSDSAGLDTAWLDAVTLRPLVPEGPPVNLGATANSSSSIALAWDDRCPNEDGFRIERKTGTEGAYAQVATVTANTTGCTDSGLSGSTTYYYRVRAYNGGGNTPYSNEASATTLSGTPPAAPSGLGVTANSSTTTVLTWTDNSSDEDGFRVERKTGAGGTYAQVGTVDPDMTVWSDNGLSPSTTYYYRVRAYNTAGDSGYCAEASVTTLAEGTPAAPSGLDVTVNSSTTTDLSWTDNSSDEDGFEVERKTGVGGTYAQVATVGPDTTTWEDSGLSPSTTYYYRVRAHSAGGYSAYCTAAAATTWAASAPTAPSGLSVTANSSKTTSLSWSDDSSDEDGFKIERKMGAGGTYAPVITVGPDTQTWDDSALWPSTTYYYRVRAYNPAGDSAYCAEASATTWAESPPTAPSGLGVTANSSTTTSLLWNDGSSDEDGFKIERKTGTGGAYAQVATVGPDTTVWADSGLSPATTYYYRVRAYNTAGNSAYCTETSATTWAASPPTAPSGLDVTANSSTTTSLAWTDSSTDEDGFEIERKTGAGGTYAQVATVGPDTEAWDDSGLSPSTTYYYRVRASSALGNSAYCTAASATTSAASPPAAPSGLGVTANSSTTTSLAWTDSSSNEDGFEIDRKTGAGGTYAQVATVGPDTTAWDDSGLSPSTTYYYRVKAYNTAGSSADSNEASATTPAANAPPAPSGLGVTANSSTTTSLAWTDNSSDEDGFKIERKTGAGGTYAQVDTV